MLYLLDTNVVSNLEKARPNNNLLGWLRDVDESEIAIPLSVVFEIQYGVDLARQSHPERAAEKEAWLRNLLLARDLQIVQPDVEDARLRARMLSTPALKNFILQCPHSKKLRTGVDVMIAATAIVHDAIVVTFDESDFKMIHDHFPLPGVFHPGRLEWIVEPGQRAWSSSRNESLNPDSMAWTPLAAVSQRPSKLSVKRGATSPVRSPTIQAVIHRRNTTI